MLHRWLSSCVRPNVILALPWLALALLPLQSAPGGSTPKPPTVLFICPHGAAKSVMASAYFKHLAAERGIDVRTDAVGTEPAPEVGPAVAARLKQQGLAVPISKPRPVTSKDIAQADIVVSIGCDTSKIPTTSKLRRWDDVPDFSDNFGAADAALRAKAQALVDEISRLR
jgi:arsenate reductase